MGSGWNWNDPITITDKGISLQVEYYNWVNSILGYMSTTDNSAGVTMLNYYFYLLQLVDGQIGTVPQTVGINPATDTGNPLNDTVVIFLADHGEYGFSHSLRGKGGGAYDEALRIPLYVMLPSQVGSQQMNQMCSEVDFFRFVVDLATGAGSNWTSNPLYADQANRQSLANFIWGSGSQQNETIRRQCTEPCLVLQNQVGRWRESAYRRQTGDL